MNNLLAGWVREIILVEFDFGGNEANQWICISEWFYSICSAGANKLLVNLMCYIALMLMCLLVFQVAWILSGTVRDNILFGREYDARRSLSLYFDKTISICLDNFSCIQLLVLSFAFLKSPFFWLTSMFLEMIFCLTWTLEMQCLKVY